MINEHVKALSDKIDELQSELEAELAKQHAKLRFGLEQGRAVFEEEILRRHAELKIRLSQYILKANPLVILSAPFIYMLIVPLVLLDIFVSIYQAVCFPIYKIEKVRRRDYFIFDRHHLAYLNLVQKINCGYCSYANCLIAYVREIAARTEKHWCPIKHAKRLIGAHEKYRDFAEYGDADAFREITEGKPQGRKAEA
ncbi:MAG: hypothetical protein KGQ41_08600 [Alphaproteobacteria bacterium]|nr:hypothetical protein [Alphaproteobacteria bacterium]